MQPNAHTLARHLAIIMDGNRRWAQRRGLPAVAGHLAGVYAIRTMVRECSDRGIEFLTLFAFSTENWKRSSFEVACLMDLLRKYLISDVPDMKSRGVRFRMVGDRTRLEPGIQDLLAFAERATAKNSKVHLTLAINYGGRWDMLQAAQAWQAAHPGESLEALEEADLSAYLSTAFAPEPDLLMRTGGESRVSNFMLWQTAYSEMFFTDVLWPEMNAGVLDQAIDWYGRCDRRFGGEPTQTPRIFSLQAS
jgi:undecaprenyl diphosphate synthase